MIDLPLFLAGLMGAAGVGLAAVAAHGAPGAGLDGAAHLLLFHALAVMAATSLIDGGRLWPGPAQLARAGWIVGASLFSISITLRAFASVHFFPMAAPTGGSILIGSWLVFAVSAAGPRRN